MIRSIISYFIPIEISRHGEIIVIIRGLRFRGNSMFDIISQIESKIEFLRNELGVDMSTVSRSVTAGNIHGRWNPDIVIFKNDIQTLYALEHYLEKQARIKIK
jgi:hypothetical protein